MARPRVLSVYGYKHNKQPSLWLVFKLTKSKLSLKIAINVPVDTFCSDKLSLTGDDRKTIGSLTDCNDRILLQSDFNELHSACP